MALRTFMRYESKYLMTTEQQRAVLGELKKYMTPDPYCTDGRLYSIYNIYFDDENDSIIRRSLSKPYFKEKLRLRSYVRIPSDSDRIFIELKRKTGGIVTKRRASLSYAQTRSFVEDGTIPDDLKYIDRQVLDEICYFKQINPVMPKVYIRYDRYAFFGNDDPEFRITFDSEIRTRRDSLSFAAGDYGTELLEENQRLMEVKVNGAMPLWLTGVMTANGINSVSFSKYGREYETSVSAQTII